MGKTPRPQSQTAERWSCLLNLSHHRQRHPVQSEDREAICGSDWRSLRNAAQLAQQKLPEPASARRSNASHHPTRTASGQPSSRSSRTAQCPLSIVDTIRHSNKPSQRIQRKLTVESTNGLFSSRFEMAGFPVAGRFLLQRRLHFTANFFGIGATGLKTAPCGFVDWIGNIAIQSNALHFFA